MNTETSTTVQKITDQQTLEDFWQVMCERGAAFEVLMEAGLTANQCVKDKSYDYDYWHTQPLEIETPFAKAKIIKSRGGILEMQKFLAFNAQWPEYQKLMESKGIVETF